MRDTEHPVRIAPPLQLPEEVRAGVDDPDRRAHWDQPASGERGPPLTYAHARETWRQVVARRARYTEVREKLASGGVRDANDLVTLNLDSQRLILDVIERADQPELVWGVWSAATSISILDPTCGSGAFLFAALKVLEPIYSACLSRMRDLRPSGADEVLAELDRHPSERYFILKSIVLNNLYGVDIMREAVEICKLRLFLKLVAQLQSYDQIEPLPDIDFNIRPGNALVGYSSVAAIRKSFERDLVNKLALPDIVARTEDAAASFARFQQIQTDSRADPAATRRAKHGLRLRMKDLRDELDRHLASDYGISLNNSQHFAKWRNSHQPFHWCAEFYGVVEESGGFDVVIGNPPYIGMGKVRERYALSTDLRTASCLDVYAPVVERSVTVMRHEGRIGMIVPLNVTFSNKYATLRHAITTQCSTSWYSSFGRIPSALFSFNVRVRNTIVIAHKSTAELSEHTKTFTTRLHRWFEEERSTLFGRLFYAEYSAGAFGGLVPKIGSARILRAMEDLCEDTYRFSHEVLSSTNSHVLYFKKSAYNWTTFCVDQPPVIGPTGERLSQTEYGRVGFFEDRDTRDIAMTILNGRLSFLWWVAVGDDFHLTRGDYETSPFGPARLTTAYRRDVERIVPLLKEAMADNITYKKNAGKLIGNYNLALCRDVTDRSDKLLLDALGLGDLWGDIELEYSLVVRTAFRTA